MEDYPTDEEVLKLQKEGHTFHCACRILSGDGECECNKQGRINGKVSAAKYAGRCAVCLERDGHKNWCKNV